MKAAIAGYFPGKQIEMTVDGGENGKGASIMARILRLDLLVPLLKGKKECEFLIGIQDNYLEQQNGNFCFRIGKELFCKNALIQFPQGKKEQDNDNESRPFLCCSGEAGRF